MNKEKLIKILRNNDVRISTYGNICLNDFVTNVIESKNSKLYIKKLNKYEKIDVKGRIYINPDDCVDILKNTNFKKCKDIYTKIYMDVGDKASIIDVENEIFQFEGHKFWVFFIDKGDGDWDVFLKASEVAKYLGYANPSEAVNDSVDVDNKYSYKKLIELFPTSKNLGGKNMDKKTIFINLSGFFNLIHKSNKPHAKKIKKWLDDIVLPSLIKYGTYIMQPDKITIKNFYDTNSFSIFDNKAILYIAYVGKYKGEHIFKFGLTRDLFQREYDKHRKQFELFKVVFIGECDNCEKIEKKFKKELKMRCISRNLIIKGKQQTELFTITNKFTHEYFIDIMKNLISTHKLPAIKEADNKITTLANVVDTYKLSDELRKLEMQYKLSENYKLELENHKLELEIRKIESETAENVKELDIKLQYEKNKQIAMEKGINPSYFYGNSLKNTTNEKIVKNNVLKI